MYERSAIVLEKYLNKRFGFDQKINLKENYKDYCNIVNESKEYQEIVIEEESLIEKFDEVAKQIQNIQAKQSKLYESNLKMEELRNQLFSDLGERPETLESKLKKVESKIAENNEELIKLGEEFIKALEIFSERQKERNKCARKKRVAETNHISYIKEEKEFFEQIDIKYIKNMKDFLESDTNEVKEELIQIMIKNGKNEKVAFHQGVIEKAISERLEIAKKEIECYLTIYERSKKLLAEIENEELKLNKYEKTLKDISVKLAFLEAEKEYIVGFLDNERMTAINGPKQHKNMMDEACQGFDEDILQIKNLYELVLKEVAGKSTKKAYKELYNKTYLKEIDQKEKNFEQELNHIKIRMGTVINSNYWRIEGIKDIYNVFQKEITEKFERDLSEYQIEEPEETDFFEDENEIVEKYDKIAEVVIDKVKEEPILDDDDIDLSEFDFGEDDDDDEEYDFDLEDEEDEEIDFSDDEPEDENDEDDYLDDEEDIEEDDEEEVDFEDEDFLDEEDDDDEEEEEIIKPETKKKKAKKRVYKQIRGKSIADIRRKKKKKENKKKSSKRGRKKQVIIDEDLDEVGELPKAMKKIKQDEEKEIVSKNSKKKKGKEQKQEEKGMFNKLFKK